MATSDEQKGIGPYSEQCFIKDFLSFFSVIHGKDRSPLDPSVEVKNALISQPVNILKADNLKLGSSLSGGRGANEGAVSFMSNLNSPHGQMLLESVPKEMMSNLQPKIDLYKVYYSSKTDRDGLAVPFPFNHFKPKEPFHEGAIGTGLRNELAVGLKEFSFDYLGTNPAEVAYYIDVNMKLWFNTVEGMFHEYELPANVAAKFKGAEKTEYHQSKLRFADLITRPSWGSAALSGERTAEQKRKCATTHLAWNPRYFRIRIDVSYAPPSDFFLDEAARALSKPGTNHNELRDRLLDAIASTKVSFFLNLLRHDFGFRGDIPSGPFELNISYNGAVESALYSPDANILRAKVDASRIEDFQGMASSPYKFMQLYADALIDELGLDPRSYDQSTFFNVESGGFPMPFSNQTPADSYKTLKDRDEMEPILENEAGIDVAKWPKNELQQKTGVRNRHQKGDAELKGWGSDYAFVDTLHMFYIYKNQWNELLAQEGLAADQIRTRMYTRILEELAGKRQCIGGKWVQRPSRIYSLQLPSYMLIQWRKKSKDRFHTPAEKRRMKAAKESGASGEEIREEIEKELEARFKRVNSDDDNAFKLRKNILTYMHKRLGMSNDYIKQHPSNPNAPEGQLLPAAPQDPTKNPIEVGWEDNINAYVSSKMSDNPDARTEHQAGQALTPASRAPSLIPLHGKVANTTITWFYFGDLIDAALDILNDTKGRLHLDVWQAPTYDAAGQIDPSGGGGAIKVILGDVTYYDPISGVKRTISLLDLPISYELFREFWSEKVIKPMAERYSFQSFLRDAMNELVAAALTNKCAIDGEPIVGIRPHIFQASVAYDARRKVYALPPAGDFLAGSPTTTRGADRAFRAQIRDVNPDSIIGHSDPVTNPAPIDMSKVPPGLSALAATHDDTMNKFDKPAQEIIYLCATTDKPISIFSGGSTRGAKMRDIQNGILYLEVGVDGTPVERISFRKQDLPWYLEAKGERTGIKGNPIELSEPYQCSFSIYGNTMMKPGTYLYIRLPHFGLPGAKQSPARRLGLGGYFFIYKTRNSLILRGNKFDWTTDVNCLWNAFGAREENRPPHLIGS